MGPRGRNTKFDGEFWREFDMNKSELDLEATLFSGQSFRWTKHNSQFVGVLGSDVVVLTYLTGETGGGGSAKLSLNPRVIFRRLNTVKASSSNEEMRMEQSRLDLIDDRLHSYFNANVDVQALLSSWRRTDENFEKKSDQFHGLRTLRVDTLEAIISFICSSNNNIPRISMMVERLCAMFSENHIDATSMQVHYRFPTLSQLTMVTEKQLRQAGFGFRAPKLVAAVRQMVALGGDEWLRSLERPDLAREPARELLQQLSGVGPKVADCVCLCSLQKHDAIPVDTHCWQLARRDYLPELAPAASLTTKRYAQIGDYFRDHFGPYAGWAFMVLFAAELSLFKRAARARQDENVQQALAVAQQPVATRRVSGFFRRGATELLLVNKGGGSEVDDDVGVEPRAQHQHRHDFMAWKRRKRG